MLQGWRERGCPIAGGASLTVVHQDRLGDRSCATVVQETADGSEAPERRGPELATGRLSLHHPVAQAAHVVQQEVGERLKGHLVQCWHGVRTGSEGRHVAIRAADVLEYRFALTLSLAHRSARRRGQERHEVREGLDTGSVVVETGGRIEHQSAAAPCGQFSLGNIGLVMPSSFT